MNTSKLGIAFVANGELENSSELKRKILSHACIVAVDGGLKHCDAMGIIPHYLIGDFDSAPQGLKQKYLAIPSFSYPKDKDDSDLELALKKFYDNQERITVYGALGHRMDHALYNLFLLLRYPTILTFEDQRQILFALDPGHHRIECFPGQTLSLMPLANPCFGISSVGLKWEVQNYTFNQNAMSLSNICLGNSFTIEIKEGNLICCLQKGNHVRT